MTTNTTIKKGKTHTAAFGYLHFARRQLLVCELQLLAVVLSLPFLSEISTQKMKRK